MTKFFWNARGTWFETSCCTLVFRVIDSTRHNTKNTALVDPALIRKTLLAWSALLSIQPQFRSDEHFHVERPERLSPIQEIRFMSRDQLGASCTSWNPSKHVFELMDIQRSWLVLV